MKLRALVPTTVGMLAACSEGPEPPPIVWEGEHVRFGTNADDSTICAGTLPYLDEVAGHLGSVFGNPDAIVDYHWVPDGIAEFCGSNGLGCSTEQGAFSRYVVHQHELAHSVRWPSRLYLPLEEGLAEAFGDDWDPPPYEFEGKIGDLLRNPGDHFPGNGYALAGHFVSYLRSVHGLEPLVELDAVTDYESSFAGTEAAFADVFGVSLDETVADYEATYPRCPMRVYRDKSLDCSRNLVPAPTEVGEQIEHVVTLACDDPTVLGPRFGARWTTVSLDVQVAGRYFVVVMPEGEIGLEFARLTRCDLDCFEYADDVFSRTTGTEIGVGVCLEPGRYLFRFGGSGEGGGQVRLLVSRSEDSLCD